MILSLINANSPLVWDAAMLGAAQAYAEANQATLLTPFILAGRDGAGDRGRRLRPDARRGARPGWRSCSSSGPARRWCSARSRSSMSMQSGAPTFGTPEPALVLYVMAALARRLGVPFRSGGNLCASKIADAQAAYESARDLQPTILGGVNFVLHAAGWLEGGLAVGYEKFILDADQCGMAAVFVKGVDLTENGQAIDAIRANGPGQHFLGTAHTLANFENAFYRSEIADNNSFEQWQEDGSLDAAQRANAIWKRMLAEYEAPPLDAAIDEALLEFIARRKAAHARLGRLGRAVPPPRAADAGERRASPASSRRRRSSWCRSRTPSTRPTTCRRARPSRSRRHRPRGSRRPSRCASRSRRRGFRAVPHLSARMVRDRAHLADLIAWLEGAGVDRAFVVGGDAKEPGDYPDGLALLREMAEIGHPLAEIGIPCYPQGHAFIPDGPLLEALRAKAEFASYMTTQLCFDPGAIGSWIAARRAEGLAAPGAHRVPGVAEPHKLLAISARIGVADTHRFLTKNTPVRRPADPVRRVLPARRAARGPRAGHRGPGARVVDLHLYTFNNVDATERGVRLSRSTADAGGRVTLERSGGPALAEQGGVGHHVAHN